MDFLLSRWETQFGRLQSKQWAVAQELNSTHYATLKMKLNEREKRRTKRFAKPLGTTSYLMRPSEWRLVVNMVCCSMMDIRTNTHTHTASMAVWKIKKHTFSGEWLMSWCSRQQPKQRPQQCDPFLTIKTLQTQSFLLDCCFSVAIISLIDGIASANAPAIRNNFTSSKHINELECTLCCIRCYHTFHLFYTWICI